MTEFQDKFWIIQLAKEFQSIVYYYKINLTQPFITISSSQQTLGSWNQMTRTITMSRFLIEKESWDVVLEIFKHEIAHMLSQSEASRDEETSHGKSFQKACKKLGVSSWARAANVEIDPDAAKASHRNLSEEKERQLRRIEKLLSLAKSSNTHEASLAMERAMALSSQYQIEMASEQRNYTYAVINHRRKRMPVQHAAIASILCSHFYVDCVSRKLYDAKTFEDFQVLEILGTTENVAVAEYVYWYLWNELPMLFQGYQKAKDGPKKSKSMRSFYLGVLTGFHQKLSLDKEAAQRAAREGVSPVVTEPMNGLMAISSSLELILKKELDSFVAERFPQLRRGNGGKSGVEVDAYQSGLSRGSNLDIRPGVGSGSAPLALKGGEE